MVFPTDLWHRSNRVIADNLYKSMVAISWVRRPDTRRGESEPSLQNATGFIATCNGYSFVMTAGHVLTALRYQLEHNLVARLTLLDFASSERQDGGIPIIRTPDSLIHIDDPLSKLDVGCILIGKHEMELFLKTGGVPVPVPNRKPDSFGDLTVAMGMPAMATERSLTSMGCGGILASFRFSAPLIPFIVDEVASTDYRLRLKLAGQITFPAGNVLDTFDASGMSGGPLFSVMLEDQQAKCRLLGILCAQDDSEADRHYYACYPHDFVLHLCSAIDSLKKT